MSQRKPPQLPKKAEVSIVRSSAAEYLTFIAASKDNQAFLHARFGLGDDMDELLAEYGAPS